jgi:ribosome-binding factor A
MSSRRVLKVAEAIREVVSMAILTELRDPRVQDVTVTYVQVSGDLRLATIHVSVMGDDKKQQLCLHGLQSARGFLQRKVSDRLEMKFTPQISFELDQGVKNSAAVARILREVLPPASLSNDDLVEHDAAPDP